MFGSLSQVRTSVPNRQWALNERKQSPSQKEVPECWDGKPLGGTHEIGGAIVDNEYNLELVFGDHFGRRASDGFWIRFENWKAQCSAMQLNLNAGTDVSG